ncbi:MAG TPA: polysaccharide biosynthesis/export family protein [Candidatus Binataceae bacterium]|nr:polysaccharide biosynthesis/export family protein [Candidatus Binataceae bacterium]
MLWQQRDSRADTNFSIGSGDVITVSVPEIDEIQKQKIRVGPDGTIALPLIGTMTVSGLTENEVRTALVQRLAVYMKFPRVELFVEHYQARDVAVIGAVEKPGLYHLSNSEESIIDVIGLAGGMTTEAAQTVIFIPPGYNEPFSSNVHADRTAGRQFADASPEPVNRSTIVDWIPEDRHLGPEKMLDPADLEASLPGHLQRLTPSGTRGRPWIQLDLARPGDRACLELPARPHDVVLIPIAGEVMVEGWVRRPGAVKISPDMTVLGAVSAAGGAMFSSTAQLLRVNAQTRQATQFDLSKLASGEQSDIPVQSGDVVVLEKSLLGAVPYTVYQLFGRFGAGLGLPVP